MIFITVKRAVIAALALRVTAANPVDSVSMTTPKTVVGEDVSHCEIRGFRTATYPSQSYSSSLPTSSVVNPETNLKEVVVTEARQSHQSSVPTHTSGQSQATETVPLLEQRKMLYTPVIIPSCHEAVCTDEKTGLSNWAIAGITIGSIVGSVILASVIKSMIKSCRARCRRRNGRVDVQREQRKSILLGRILRGRTERSNGVHSDAV
ncbi:hypothetical protein F4779DRAFT_639274 [Xylariaceae sp. FL0662B]|nr:hypothetical protein F4779DRAFT_639274 [Xylariaceae sp. FL0662B]